MRDPNKYNFSFTTSSLRLNEMVLVAKHITEGYELDITNNLGGGNSTTGKKMFSELKKRISHLKAPQIEILVHGDLISQRQIAYLSVCKTFFFIRDFVVDVIREKHLLFDYNLTEGEYISFYRRKIDSHPELDELTEITQNKIRQVTFKMLEQVGIIDNIKSKTIQPQLLDNKVIQAIVMDNPVWLKIFLMSDMDIDNLTK